MLKFFLGLSDNPYDLRANDIGIPNSTGTISDGFVRATALLMSVVGGLAVIFLIVGALQIVLSGGDPKRYQQGRSTITYSIIGIIVALVGYAVITFVVGSL